jgi:hypothetical protein
VFLVSHVANYLNPFIGYGGPQVPHLGSVVDYSPRSAEILELTPRKTYLVKDRDVRFCTGNYTRP